MFKKYLNTATLLAVFSMLFISSCSSPYAPAPQILPQHIRKISIKPFINNTSQYGLEEKLTLAVTNEFIRDGRLSITNDETEADALIIGDIKKYILQPLTYDANLVPEQYKLWVILNVYFVDKVNNVTLWAEPNLEGIQIFTDINLPGGKTEDEVREILWENFSMDIVKRTIQGFGSVTGTSDKKVPK